MDRMEIIDFTSYTEDEKVQIAKKYLVPKQIKENGLKAARLNSPMPSCAVSSPATPVNPGSAAWKR